jgi:hypothetical protein
MRPILSAISLTGALCMLFAIALPSVTLGAEPADANTSRRGIVRRQD